MAVLHEEIARINETLARAVKPEAELIQSMSDKGRELTRLENEWMSLSEERDRLTASMKASGA